MPNLIAVSAKVPSSSSSGVGIYAWRLPRRCDRPHLDPDVSARYTVLFRPSSMPPSPSGLVSFSRHCWLRLTYREHRHYGLGMPRCRATRHRAMPDNRYGTKRSSFKALFLLSSPGLVLFHEVGTLPYPVVAYPVSTK